MRAPRCLCSIFQWLKDDTVLYGLVRMGFGSGKFRREKWIFVHWTGEKTPPVRRGRWNAAKSKLHEALSPVSVNIEATCLDDLTLDKVIDKVRRAAVVDGETKRDEANPFSMVRSRARGCRFTPMCSRDGWCWAGARAGGVHGGAGGGAESERGILWRRGARARTHAKEVGGG